MMMSSERIVPVGCRDCQFFDWPVCTAPFLCWGMLKEAEEKETPGGDDDRGQGNEPQTMQPLPEKR